MRSRGTLAAALLVASACSSFLVRRDEWHRSGRVAIAAFDAPGSSIQYDAVYDAYSHNRRFTLPPVTRAMVEASLAPPFRQLATFLSKRGLEVVPPSEVAAAEARLLQLVPADAAHAPSFGGCITWGGRDCAIWSIVGPRALELDGEMARYVAEATRADLVVEVHVGGDLTDDRMTVYVEARDRDGRLVWRDDTWLGQTVIVPFEIPPPFPVDVSTSLDRMFARLERALSR